MRAKYWYKEAIKNGSNHAIRNLAILHEDEKNFDAAEVLYKKLAYSTNKEDEQLKKYSYMDLVRLNSKKKMIKRLIFGPRLPLCLKYLGTMMPMQKNSFA